MKDKDIFAKPWVIKLAAGWYGQTCLISEQSSGKGHICVGGAGLKRLKGRDVWKGVFPKGRITRVKAQ